MAKKSNTEQNQTPKLTPFEQAIKAYLDGRAAEDELFAKSYAKDGKSIKECCQYIIGEAEKNSIVVACLYHIFRNLFVDTEPAAGTQTKLF